MNWRKLIGPTLWWSAVFLTAGLCVGYTLDANAAIPAPVGVTVKHQPASTHQREMLGRVLATCRMMGARPKVQIAAVATTTQEAAAKNLTGGHGTSVGLFQIINLHGTYEQRHNPEWSANWFCSRAIRADKQRPHLGIGALAQSVQRSAYPNGYQQWVREAKRTTLLTYQHLQCG